MVDNRYDKSGDRNSELSGKIIDLVSKQKEKRRTLYQHQKAQSEVQRISDLEIKVKQLIDLMIDLVRHTEDIDEWKNRTNTRIIEVVVQMEKIKESLRK